MKPYYDQDGITIYHGDCREILPTLGRFDCVVSSPPYNMIPTTKPSGLWKEHKHKANEGYESYEDNMPQEEYEEFVVNVFAMCIEKTDGVVWVNHKTKHINGSAIHPARIYPFELFAEIIWDCNGSRVLNANRYAPSHEHILGFGTKVFWDRCNDTKMSVWRMQPEREGIHPCPFPLAIPKRLISSSCQVGGIVIDPFMGSGTTLRAAKDLGRKAVGIEIDERYCEIAANRLAQGVLF